MNRKSENLYKEPFEISLFPKAILAIAVVFGLIFLLGYFFRRPRYHPTGYQLIHERVVSDLAYRKIHGFIPKNEMLMTDQKDDSATFWGWVVTGDSSNVSTQWFRIDGFLNDNRELYEIYNLRVLIGKPAVFEKKPL